MAQFISLPQLGWHGPKELRLPLPDGWQVEVCNMAGYNHPAMTDDQIQASLSHLIGEAPIRELARGKKEVVIIFDDMARITRVAKIVPYVLKELAAGGIPDSKIRFIAATGAHGAMNREDLIKKLGEATLANFPVYNHNPFDNCTYVGTTSYGTKVSINADVMQCDFKITIGTITPHPLSAFSGGGKLILPGVASIETIVHNHTLPGVNRNDYDTNKVHFDLKEAAELVGIDVTIECIVNLWGDTVAIFAGAPEPAHAAGIQEARTHYLTPKAEGKDIVIANTYAKAVEAEIGAITASPSVSQRGGDFVLVCNAPQGHTVHYLGGAWGKTTTGRLGLVFPIPENINHMIIYNEYPDSAFLGWFEESAKRLSMNNWDDVLQVLEKIHSHDARVAVYPNADIQYFG